MVLANFGAPGCTPGGDPSGVPGVGPGGELPREELTQVEPCDLTKRLASLDAAMAPKMVGGCE